MLISFAVSSPAFSFTITVTNLTGTGSGKVNLLATNGGVILDSCAPTIAGCTFSQPALTGNVLQAVPDGTSVFAGWTNTLTPGGACPATGACNVTITGNWTVDAKFEPSLPCTYAIFPTSSSFTSAGGSSSINISYTPGSCTVGPWTAVSNVPWITVTSGNTGNGTGAANYSVASSTGAASRTGTIAVAGQTFTVMQSANSSRLITLSADSLDFGTVKTATPCPATLTISNVGSSPLVINSVNISGTNAGDFSALYECSTIPAGSSCPVTVLFSPSAGAENATLTVNSTDTIFPAYNVALSGTASGTAAANISLNLKTPPSILYPPTDINNGNTSLITITNTGTGSLVISSVDIEGRDATEFTTTNTCPVIAAGAICTLNLNSSYTSNAAKQASLVISSNAAGTPKVEVPISTGMPSCDISSISLSATSQSVDYGGANGTIAVNASSSCQWQPLSNDPWITITSGSGWTAGNGTVGYSLSANANNANILGNMTVAGKHFTIVQYGSSRNSIFNDNTDASVSDYINALAARGITTGCGNNDFCPDESVTREEMAAFIVRALEGEPPASYCSAGSPFSDVSSDSTWCKYVKRLYELGITTGCGSGIFCPDTTVTRDTMAVLLVRALVGDNFSYGTTPYFSDVPSGYWAFQYIQKLKEFGITVGCGNNNYCPAEVVSRAYMAIFLDRAFLGMQ